MDPNACLKEMLELSDKALEYVEAGPRRAGSGGGPKWSVEETARLAELVQSLDAWLCKGGFLPRRWTQGGVTMKVK